MEGDSGSYAHQVLGFSHFDNQISCFAQITWLFAAVTANERRYFKPIAFYGGLNTQKKGLKIHDN